MAMRTGFGNADLVLKRELESTVNSEDAKSILGQAIEGFVSSLSSDEILLVDNLDAHRLIPTAIDSRLLATCRSILVRDLDNVERTDMRKRFREAVRERLKGL